MVHSCNAEEHSRALRSKDYWPCGSLKLLQFPQQADSVMEISLGGLLGSISGINTRKGKGREGSRSGQREKLSVNEF